MEFQITRPKIASLCLNRDDPDIIMSPQILDQVTPLRDVGVQAPIHDNVLIRVISIHDDHDESVSGQRTRPDLPSASEDVTVDGRVHPAPDGVPAAAVLHTSRLSTQRILIDVQ